MTHQCFLSTRSLYLVVWNVTEGEEAVAELGPWLHNIQVWGYVKRPQIMTSILVKTPYYSPWFLAKIWKF